MIVLVYYVPITTQSGLVPCKKSSDYVETAVPHEYIPIVIDFINLINGEQFKQHAICSLVMINEIYPVADIFLDADVRFEERPLYGTSAPTYLECCELEDGH